MEEEIWKTLKKHNLYEVSNLGRIRNKETKHILKQTASKSHKNPTVRLKDYYWGEVQLTACWLIFNAFNDAHSEDAAYCSGGTWNDFLKKGHRLGHRDGNVYNNRLDNLYLY